MGETPVTRPSLLIRIRDPQDHEAWRRFVDLYAPVIYQFARRRGLQDADAADLTQLVLQTFTASIRRLDYDARQGRFRGWLFAVVRNQLHKFLGGRRRGVQGTGDTGVQELLEGWPAKEDDEARVWEREYERQLFVCAAEKVRCRFEESSWLAFWQTAVEGKNARETAQVLRMTVGAVYTAKSRVLDRIRQEIQQLQVDQGSFEELDHDSRRGLS